MAFQSNTLFMIDKQAYYHGAAVITLLEDARCKALHKKGLLGYVVNDGVFLFIKYTTKSRTPWRFTFDQEDVDRANRMAQEYGTVLIPMVCAGDGVCVITWDEGVLLLGNVPGFIAVARKHHEQYAVWGAYEDMKGKVSLSRWPSLAFDTHQSRVNQSPAKSLIESLV